jgi:hypothetical protein
MSPLRAAVHVAKPIPSQNADGTGPAGVWSPISCTLIYSEKEAVLVDVPTTIRQTRELINWIEEHAPSVKVSYVYITQSVHFSANEGTKRMLIRAASVDTVIIGSDFLSFYKDGRTRSLSLQKER